MACSYCQTAAWARPLVALWVGLAMSLSAAAADTSAAAAAALKVLTTPAPAPEAASPAGADASTRAVYVVKGSQTLDVAIQRAVPNLPLKEAFLRQVFASLNPKALPSGAANVVLRSGTSLQVPTMEDLRYFMAQAAPELMGRAGRKGASMESGEEESPADLKKRWPRFP